MEGLIKGLINVALDAIDGDGEQEQRRNQATSTQEEEVGERSRATWAEVVSSKSDDNQSEAHSTGAAYHRPSSWDRKEKTEESGGAKWGNVGAANQSYSHQPPRRHHNEESEEIKEEDWQTVGSKKQHHPASHGRPQKSEAWNGYKKSPSEQNYSEETLHGLNTEPTQEELHDLSKACNRLWDLDRNRLVPEKDYQINVGEGKKVYRNGDMAHEPLFTWLSDDVLRKPTISRFCALLDNYNPNEGYKEEVTAQDKHEQTAFIEEISRTGPIKYVFNYLIAKGVLDCNYEEFKRIMISLWFNLCGRGGTYGSSSAFEHVFVGEIKNRGENEISGFHNWIQFYLEEAKGTVDYQGFILPRRRGELPDSETQVLTIQFEWHGILKSVSSTLIGVSPEFEIALYTLCYFVGREDNGVNLGPYCVNIKCYRMGNDKIGSVFPIVEN
ncbi:poly(U)-specific endoribonuclease-B-like protein [Carex littledalei]|uniref:Poly(U)-specific endoribonuclease-B-like protein n=1 Tax=Carex littledalei TaxID=544730 RepID=A0A833RFP9_9POAL|nr:poly(U)-specific endoribonuclease-B-like protein [Carex littledalei]